METITVAIIHKERHDGHSLLGYSEMTHFNVPATDTFFNFNGTQYVVYQRVQFDLNGSSGMALIVRDNDDRAFPPVDIGRILRDFPERPRYIRGWRGPSPRSQQDEPTQLVVKQTAEPTITEPSVTEPLVTQEAETRTETQV